MKHRIPIIALSLLMTSCLRAEPTTKPATQPSQFRAYVPFDPGTRYDFGYFQEKPFPSSLAYECLKTHEIAGVRIGIFAGKWKGTEHGFAMVLAKQRVWFVQIPIEKNQPNAATVKSLLKNADKFREAKKPEELPEELMISGTANFADHVRNAYLPAGEFITVKVEGNCLIPWNVRQKRPLKRAGGAVFQRNVGLVQLHTRDRTRHGHAIQLDLTGYLPGADKKMKSWPKPVNMDRTEKYSHGKWSFALTVWKTETGFVRRKGILIYDGKPIRYSGSPPPILTPWGIMRHYPSHLLLGWVPVTPATGTISNAHATSRPTATAPAVRAAVMAILKRLEAAGEKYPNITANIDYKVDMLQTGDTEIRTGKVYYQGPGKKESAKFRIHFDTLRQGKGPKIKDVVDYAFDGAWLTVRKERIKQMSRYQVAPPGKKVNPLQLGKGPFPVPFGQKADAVIKHFRPTTRPAKKTDPKNTDYIKLKTRKKYRKEFSVVWLEMWIDRKTSLPVKIVAEDRSENQTTVIFKDTKTPKSFDKKIFTLPRPPAGWEYHVERFKGRGKP